MKNILAHARRTARSGGRGAQFSSTSASRSDDRSGDRNGRPRAVSLDHPFPWEQQRPAQRRWRDPLRSRRGTPPQSVQMPAMRAESEHHVRDRFASETALSERVRCDEGRRQRAGWRTSASPPERSRLDRSPRDRVRPDPTVRRPDSSRLLWFSRRRGPSDCKGDAAIVPGVVRPAPGRTVGIACGVRMGPAPHGPLCPEGEACWTPARASEMAPFAWIQQHGRLRLRLLDRPGR